MLQLAISKWGNMNQLFAQATEYNYGYEAVSEGTNDDGSLIIIRSIVLVSLILILIGYVITSFLLGKIFTKAHIPAWKGWVPVYNTWIIMQLGGQQGFWAIVGLFPVVQIAGVIFLYIAMYQIGRRFNKPNAFVLLAIFAPIVWMIWLAYDKSKWQGKKLETAKPVTAVKTFKK